MLNPALLNRIRFLVAAGAPVLAATLHLGCSSPREFIPGTKQFGQDCSSPGTVCGSQTLTSIAVGPEGQVALTGSFDRQIDFGGGPLASAGIEDIFVAALDDASAPLWSGRTGSYGSQSGQAIAAAPNGDVILAGNFIGDISFGHGQVNANSQSVFLTRFDPGGVELWSKKLGGSGGSVFVSGLALAPDGDIVIGGWFYGETNLGGGPLSSPGQASFVARFDAEGNHVYSLGFGGSGNQVNAVSVDATGAVLVTGINSGTLNLGESFTSSGTSVFVAKLDSDGAPEWLAQFGNGGYASALGIAVDPADDVVVTGVHSDSISFGGDDFPSVGGSDAFVAKLSGAGAPLWFKSFGAPNSSANASRVAVDSEGHILFTGTYSGQIDFGGGALAGLSFSSSAFLVELDEGGAHMNSRAFAGGQTGSSTGSTASSTGSTLALDPAGGVVIGGVFSGSIVVDGVSLTSKSPSDIFLIRQKR
jgi:hypothetical protein